MESLSNTRTTDIERVKEVIRCQDNFQSTTFCVGGKLVHVQKNSGNIRSCVDFKNLKRVVDKDSYHVSSIEYILQLVWDSNMFSLTHGLSIYN